MYAFVIVISNTHICSIQFGVYHIMPRLMITNVATGVLILLLISYNIRSAKKERVISINAF